MCGIVGYTGTANAPELLIEALKKLEYRGYDSSGIAIRSAEGLEVVKALGEIKFLEQKLQGLVIQGTTGISHTRWATHGVPSEENAHPHTDCADTIAVVHNGIIENYLSIREELLERGHTFSSDTDTEVIGHLIEERYRSLLGTSQEGQDNSEKDTGDVLFEAVRSIIPSLHGAYALVVTCSDSDSIIGVREKSPLVIGTGSGENFLASDVSALLKYTSDIMYLDDGEAVRLDKDSITVINSDGVSIEPRIEQISWGAEDAQKGGYDHFMLKEIHDQVSSIKSTIMEMTGDNIKRDSDMRSLLNLIPEVKEIVIIACGTSFNAGHIGKYFIERFTAIPVNMIHASEYRYSSPLLNNPLMIAITQSGETADTLAAVKEAKQRGSLTLAITNVVGSSITREADFAFYTRAGPEIGVAATKTFTAQIMVLFLLSLQLAKGGRNSFITQEAITALEKDIHIIPRLVQRVLEETDDIRTTARFLAEAHSIFYIGRNINYPTAEEGALKIKEISYIHAEAYPAGELKHGPLALLAPDTPVVALTANDHVREKIYSNIGEVCARKAPVIIVAEEGDEMAYKFTDRVLTYPSCPPEISPLPISVLLQLLAYYTAKELDCAIDKPRNLAKSVTVE